ncbi:MAG: septal ring lytic transglycosylase RlpA family protein [Candidatus Rokubacteria bacterium]|nr:septal ring lytic transglycosylase RlpA family protein [Candidatus Rokubacteria bacterium]
MAPWLVMRLRWLVPLGFTTALLGLSACARPLVVAPPVPARVEAEATGYASWYGHPHHGRQTASGEVYDMNNLTAAHRTLPLGTRLMVTSIDTGQAVEVRVNDRGPFIDGRILDLSYGAARVVGAVGPGVIPVRLRILALPGASDKPPAASAAAAFPAAPFAVQAGAFTTRARAETLRAAVERDGVDAMLFEVAVDPETFYRVRLGAYPNRPARLAVARRLATRGYRRVVGEGKRARLH